MAKLTTGGDLFEPLVIGARYSNPGTVITAETVRGDLTIFWVKPHKESSNVIGYAYNEDKKILAVKFMGGSIYTYSEVSNDTYLNIIAVDATEASLGSWIRANVIQKPELYPFKKEN